MDEINKNDGADLQIYEIGYHILPTVGEDELPKEVSKIQNLVSSKGGTVIAEEFPELRALAYEIAKRVETKYNRYMKAYFGWLKFEISKDKVAEIEQALKDNASVLRYIVIKTVRENTMSPIIKMQAAPKKEEVAAPVEEIAKPEVSEAEIDKSIDELVI